MYEIIYAYIILTSIRKKTHHIVMGQSTTSWLPLQLHTCQSFVIRKQEIFFKCSGFESFWLKQNHEISNALSNDQNVLCNCFPCSLVISHWQLYNYSVHKPLSVSGFYSRKIPYENRCLLSRFENRTLPLRFKSVWCLIN